jgi:hypothetical protein
MPADTHLKASDACSQPRSSSLLTTWRPLGGPPSTGGSLPDAHVLRTSGSPAQQARRRFKSSHQHEALHHPLCEASHLPKRIQNGEQSTQSVFHLVQVIQPAAASAAAAAAAGAPQPSSVRSASTAASAASASCRVKPSAPPAARPARRVRASMPPASLQH